MTQPTPVRPFATLPDVVFLDVGDTLMRADPSWPEVYISALSRHDIRPHPDELATALREATARHRWDAEKPFERSAEASYARIVALDRRVLAALGHPRVPDEVFRSIHAAFRERSAWHIYPDVGPALHALAAAGIRLAVISNWLWEAPELFHEVGLSSHFERLFVSAHIGYDKPHPEIFRQALATMEVEPGRAVHVGDSYRADVLGARAAGIVPVLIRRDASDFGHVVGRVEDDDEVPVIADLYGLLDLLGVPLPGGTPVAAPSA